MADQDTARLIRAMTQNSAATLAAAIVAARGKPVSIQQVLDIARDVHFAIEPAPGNGAYDAWVRTKHEHLSKVYD
jgi:hypothetical protein